MSGDDKRKPYSEDVETALIDADLFVKYKAPQRAIERLREAIAHHPRSIILREKLREVTVANSQPDEAARQCLALATLYIERENFEAAHERLLEAKHIDARINIAPGLQAIRNARRPNLVQSAPAVAPLTPGEPRRATFAGDLSVVSIFDAVQVIENSRLTGALAIENSETKGRILFNEGRIVGAESGGSTGPAAFRLFVEVTAGAFDFERAAEEYPVTIHALTNTNLLLDTLRQLDEERGEGEE